MDLLDVNKNFVFNLKKEWRNIKILNNKTIRGQTKNAHLGIKDPKIVVKISWHRPFEKDVPIHSVLHKVISYM